MPEQDFMRDVAEAEMILVGLGNEIDAYGLRDQYDKNRAERYAGHAEKVLKKLENTEYAWLIPAYRDMMADGDKIRRALEKLRNLLEGKNYFLISQAQSSPIPEIRWRAGRLAMPCGSAWKKQCAENCSAEETETGETCVPLSLEERDALRECCGKLQTWLEDNDSGKEEETQKNPVLSGEVLRALEQIGRISEKEEISSLLKERIPRDLLGKCPRCGAGMILNVVQAEHYDERGYLSDWQSYTKWLQGSVNRKLLVLELGVGMQFPGVIRIPFEKIAFLNQKAKMYRIHENLYQLPEQLSEKGVGIAENTIDWLNNL